MATMKQTQESVSDLMKSNGHYPEPELVASIARCVHVCVAAFEQTKKQDGQQRLFVLLSMNALTSAYYNEAKKHLGRPIARDRRQFEILDDCLLELYGIKMLEPEVWDQQAMLLSLFEMKRVGYHIANTRAFEFLQIENITDPVVHPVLRDTGGDE